MADYLSKSHPSRGAWIEIDKLVEGIKSEWGRTPRGVRGLKLVAIIEAAAAREVAPLAGCGD